MGALRASFLAAGFLVLTLICVPFQWIALRLALPSRAIIPMYYHWMLCRLFGMRIRVIGEPIKGGGLILANHTSWMDILILSSIRPLSFVAKSEVNSWPLFGFLARMQRTIFVRRAERSRAMADRDAIRERLAAGEVLVIFAEGTSSDGNRVLPFKSALVSAAETALEGGSNAVRHPPVQPVSIAYVAVHGIPMGRELRPHYAWYGDMDLLPHIWGAFSWGPVDIEVEFHRPLTIDDAGDRKRLAAGAERAVRVGLTRALRGAQTQIVGLGRSRTDGDESAAAE